MTDLNPEEVPKARQIAYEKSLARGDGQSPPPYNREAAIGDFWQAAGEVIAQRAQPYIGWTVIHRVMAEYDQHFPNFSRHIHDTLAQEFPGANVLLDHFEQCAEEPIVLPPPGVQGQAISDARAKARSAYDGAVRTLVTRKQPPEAHDGIGSGGSTPSTLCGEAHVPTDVSDVQGTWLVIIPMFQLEVSDDPPINGKWNVGDVSFVSRDQLAATLRPPTLTNIPRQSVWQQIAGEDSSFAIITLNGTPQQLRHTAFRQIREAANVLAATAAFYGKRYHVSGFTLKGYPAFTAKHDRFIQTDGTAFCGSWNQRGFLHPFVLDANWHTAITESGIIALFDRIVDNTICTHWRRQIRSGAAMLGRSLMSLDLADAFLLDVIGLETLLTTWRERNGSKLAQRIKGMTGWHLRTARPDYDNEIKKIHRVRCEIVHDSDYSNLTVELLLQADMYLANSLLNIVRLPTVFRDKATLAATLDDFATHENWPTDGSLPFCWFGNPQFSPADLNLPLW